MSSKHMCGRGIISGMLLDIDLCHSSWMLLEVCDDSFGGVTSHAPHVPGEIYTCVSSTHSRSNMLNWQLILIGSITGNVYKLCCSTKSTLALECKVLSR